MYLSVCCSTNTCFILVQFTKCVICIMWLHVYNLSVNVNAIRKCMFVCIIIMYYYYYRCVGGREGPDNANMTISIICESSVWTSFTVHPLPQPTKDHLAILLHSSVKHDDNRHQSVRAVCWTLTVSHPSVNMVVLSTVSHLRSVSVSLHHTPGQCLCHCITPWVSVCVTP